jgi:hypothetical protein
LRLQVWTREWKFAKVRNPYIYCIPMLAKITSKNQLTLPKSATQAVGATEYFDVEVRAGQIILTPVRIQRGDAVRAKLAELALSQTDVAGAVAWVRSPAASAVRAAEPAAAYAPAPAKAASKKSTPAARKKAASKKPSSKA